MFRLCLCRLLRFPSDLLRLMGWFARQSGLLIERLSGNYFEGLLISRIMFDPKLMELKLWPTETNSILLRDSTG